MNLKEYAESKHLSPSTVTKYIKSHEDLFDGLTKRTGKAVELSDEATALLNTHFTKTPADIIPAEYLDELDELRSQLLRAQERIIQLQDEQRDHLTLIASAQAQQLLIETTQAELKERSEQLLEEKGKVKSLETKTATMQQLLDFQAQSLELAQKGQSEAEERLRDAQVEVIALKSSVTGKQDEIERLESELQKVRNRGFFARLFNKF